MQTECLRILLDSVWCCLRACASCLREIKTVWYFLSAVVIWSTIDHAMSSKGITEERQFLIEFIEEYRSLPALWCVTSTEYRIKKMNRTLNYWKNARKSILNVEKKYVIKKINSIRACSRKELKKIHTVAWATWRLAPHACTVCSSRQAICANKFAQIACTCRGCIRWIFLCRYLVIFYSTTATHYVVQLAMLPLRRCSWKHCQHTKDESISNIDDEINFFAG